MGEVPSYSYNSSTLGSGVRQRWWKEAEPASHVVAVVKAIEASADHNARKYADLSYASLYENQDLKSLYETGLATGIQARLGDTLGYRVTFNIVQSCIETAAAKIAKNKTRVQFITSGGKHDQQQRAKGLTKFCDGLFDATRIYNQGQRVFVDGCVFGSGALKLYTEDATIKAERVLTGELFCDDTESIYGEPRSIYQRKYVYRDVLLDMAGKDEDKQKAIEMATGGKPGTELRASLRASDMIPVYEAWHLPSSKDAGDGLHVICIDGCTLFKEKWKKKYFPFVWFRWADRLVGMWGRGIVEQLHGIQLEVNKLLERIRDSQHLCSSPRYLSEKGSELNVSKLTNEPGTVVTYTGTKPELWVSNAVASELYAHLETLYRRAFELVGISQLSANAKKPEGLDAAVAIREFHDIESERFVVVAQRYEQMFLDAAEIMIDMARDLYASDDEMRVKAPGTKFLESIAWKDVMLEEDQYVMRAFPTSILPTTPSGRLQKVTEIYESGILTDNSPSGVWARSMLDFPDVEGFMSLQNAALDDVQRIIGKIVDKGKYEPPEEFMDLSLAIQLGQSAYLRARNEGVPEKRKQLLMQFVDECFALKQSTQPAPAAAPATPAGTAPAVDPALSALDPTAMATSPAVPSDLPVLA